MARPLKTGIDYFPLDVINDDKIELLEAKFGLEGYGLLVKLWQKIYSNGYFLEWNEDVSLLFSRRINSDINLVNAVVNECLLRNLFNNNMSKKHGILTSNGIQERYFKICSDCRRKNIKIISEYLLVNIKDYKFTPTLTRFPPALTPLMLEESTQIKEEEIKEDNKKEEEEEKASATSAEKSFSENIGLITPFIFESMQHLIEDGVTEELIVEYIKEATIRNKKSWKYIEKMALGNLENNIQTVEQYKSYQLERDANRREQNGNYKDTETNRGEDKADEYKGYTGIWL